MQLMGCRVTTINCPGFINTVHSSNLLYDNEFQLSKSIIELLNEKDINENYLDVYQFIKNNFSFENVIKKWEFHILNFKSNLMVDENIENNFHLKKNERKLKNFEN